MNTSFKLVIFAKLKKMADLNPSVLQLTKLLALKAGKAVQTVEINVY